jgi:hypothetical protein
MTPRTKVNLAQFLIKGIIVVALVMGLTFLFFRAVALPTVFLSWPGEECIRVQGAADHHTCDNLPDKYHVQYIGHRYHTQDDLPQGRAVE